MQPSNPPFPTPAAPNFLRTIRAAGFTAFSALTSYVLGQFRTPMFGERYDVDRATTLGGAFCVAAAATAGGIVATTYLASRDAAQWSQLANRQIHDVEQGRSGYLDILTRLEQIDPNAHAGEYVPSVNSHSL